MENNFITLTSGFTCDGIFGFGKHKGKSFIEVATELKEPDYFLWIRTNIKGRLDNDLNRFIEENLDKLKSLPTIDHEPEGDCGDLCF
jgi:hypothetical protein